MRSLKSSTWRGEIIHVGRRSTRVDQGAPFTGRYMAPEGLEIGVGSRSDTLGLSV